MNRTFQLLATMLLVISFSSCVQPSKLYYFHDQVPSVQQIDSVQLNGLQRIHKSDRLSITISSTDPQLTAYLNPFNVQTSANNASQQANTGYLVNQQGTIEFPLLGKVPVEGLTTVEASTLIKDKLSYYYKDLFVNVNLNGRVYFMNGRIGTSVQMLNERLTIFEAISQSGTQDPYDKKNEVWLVREDSSQRQFAKLDLNSKKIFESPYYYLRNNDLIYMMPGKNTPVFSPNSPIRGIATIVGAVGGLVAVLIALRNL
jgi:polysaccharide export outer membrane protein